MRHLGRGGGRRLGREPAGEAPIRPFAPRGSGEFPVAEACGGGHCLSAAHGAAGGGGLCAA
eukprot:scaffold8477_cov112-Isochrysis_galbana.AAC.1